jgi:hypothetical protein
LLLVPAAGSANRLIGIGVQGCIAEVTFPRQEVVQMQK